MGSNLSNQQKPEEEEEEDVQIDPIRIIWDSMGNIKFVTKDEAEEKYDDSGRKAELDAILRAEWEDQQEESRKEESKSKEKEEKTKKFKETIERLRKEQRDKIDEAIKNRLELPPPLVEPQMEDDTEETTWYVMSSAWIESWLEYANVQKGLDRKLIRIIEAPYPGPCDNSVLLEWSLDDAADDPDNSEITYSWKAKKNLVLANSNDIGDYRRISKRVWNAYQKLYPKSGPEIIMKYKTTEKYENAKLIYVSTTDTKDWLLKTPLLPPAGAKLKKKKKKRKQQKKSSTDIVEGEKTSKGINEKTVKTNNSIPGTAKSPIMELASLTSAGPDSDDDSIDDLILSGGKSNIKTLSPTNNSKIAFQTVGKDSDDDDEDVISPALSPPKIIIPATKVSNTSISSSSSNSKKLLHSILIRAKDSDDDSDEGFDITKNNEKLKLGTLMKNKTTVNGKSGDNSKSLFSINSYTQNQPDSDDDDTVIDEKAKGVSAKNITSNQKGLSITPKESTSSLAIRLDDDNPPAVVSTHQKRIDDDEPIERRRSIMSLLTSKNN